MKTLVIRRKSDVWVGTVVGTFFCIAAAFLVDLPTFAGMTPQEFKREVKIHLLVPVLLAGPLLFLLLSKIRALALAHEEMARMAMTDALTGLLNRGAFSMMAEDYLKLGSGEGQEACGSLLLIDVDHFKSINDRFGHYSGDEALRQISQVMRSAVRPADLVGRIGGEEFAVLLLGAKATQAVNVAERIRERVATMEFPEANRHLLSVSIGGVNFLRENSFDLLFKAADRCLYLAKNRGRNRVDMMEYVNKQVS